jgi:uncharacterized protein GlcG (DUF336 family)
MEDAGCPDDRDNARLRLVGGPAAASTPRVCDTERATSEHRRVARLFKKQRLSRILFWLDVEVDFMTTETRVTRTVPHDLARRVVEFAHQRAEALGITVAVCVTDPAGHLIAAGRMDRAPFGAMLLAMDKAFAAAALMAPTGTWQSSSQPGGQDWGMHTSLGGRLIVYPGGAPMLDDGEMVGAVGISGGECREDDDCAHSAIERAGLTFG